MAQILDADFNLAMGVTASANDVDGKPYWNENDYLYRKSDYIMAVGGNDNVVYKPWKILRESAITRDITAVIKFITEDGTEADPVSDPLKSPWFYDVLDVVNNAVAHHVHTNDLDTLANIKTYITAEMSDGWVDPS